MTTILLARGRPRGFDLEEALETGQSLFHARGYEAVGLAALTDALGIKPPSFYKAFGSKAEFFGRILARYAASTLALDDILRKGQPPATVLADLIERAARTYARNPQQRGCLVLEATRGNDNDESTRLARRIAEERRERIRRFVARTHPRAADAVTDYVTATLSGLSAAAREGWDEARLLTVASTTLPALDALLAGGVSKQLSLW